MKSNDGERFLRALKETLDTVVTPIVRDALIHDALILSGKMMLPVERTEMIDFAKGPLRTVTERALGAELAESVADEISRMTEATRITSAPPPPHLRRSTPAPRTARATPGHRKNAPPPSERRSDTVPGHRPPTGPPVRPESSDRHPTLTPVPRAPRRRAGQPNLSPWPTGIGSHIRRPADTEPAPPLSPSAYAEQTGTSASALVAPRPADISTIPFVLVATEDTELLRTLADWFADRAVVTRVLGVFDLVRNMDAAAGRRALVVLDGKAPSIRPPALAVLFEELTNVDVIMCRASPAVEQVVLAASQASARWLVYREPASLDHIAAECLRLVS
jgi:hypothetical protein